MIDPSSNDATLAKVSGLAGKKQARAISPKRPIKLLIALVLVVASLLDWSRPPERQISVPLYQFFVIRGYRATIRHITSHFTRCRFKPSCSQYSSEAVRKHGLPKGAWLTMKRLFRDMPWVPFGTLDPVPPRG